MKTIDLTVGDSVVLPHGVVLTVLRRKGTERVMLGLLAPAAVRINRQEAKCKTPKAGCVDPWELSREPV